MVWFEGPKRTGTHVVLQTVTSPDDVDGVSHGRRRVRS